MISHIDNTFSLLIKVISTVLITGALGLEVWIFSSGSLPDLTLPGFKFAIYFARFALISHGIEGLIAGIFASSRQQPPLRYSLYTFFVGTVGLIELFRAPQLQE
jgi:hypothetical protein